MDVGKSVIVPGKLTVALKLRVWAVGITVRVLPHIPFAGERCPVAFWDLLLITEILIPYQCRVWLSAQHLKSQLKAGRRSHHIAVDVFEFPWCKGVFRITCSGFFGKVRADTETIELDTVHAHRDFQRVLAGSEICTLGEGCPESGSPVRPP